MEILTVKNKKEEKFLRQKTIVFDFKKHKKAEIRELLKGMRKIMKDAAGVGLSANQIGLPYRLFVAQVPDDQSKLKFYAIFNPQIVKISKETDVLEEGCLSVPENYDAVERASKIVITGQDANGKKIKIKAWGMLARVFQHEIDHLNGTLFTDKTKNVYAVPKSERLKTREQEI